MVKIDKYPIPKSCPHCGSPVIYTSNAEIYGKEYGNGRCYKCTKCDSYVGVHDGTDIPLGILANKELRELKKQAHTLFDVYWKEKNCKRYKCYIQLAEKLGIDKGECHFGWFDKNTLDHAIAILKQGLF